MTGMRLSADDHRTLIRGGIVWLSPEPDLDDLIGMDDPGLDIEAFDQLLAQNGFSRVSEDWHSIVMGGNA